SAEAQGTRGESQMRSGAASVRSTSIGQTALSRTKNRGRFAVPHSSRRWLAFSAITLFLAAICIGLVVQVLDMRTRSIKGMSETLDLLASRMAQDIAQAASSGLDVQMLVADVVRAVPPEVSRHGRGFLVSDPSGHILASVSTGLGSVGGDLNAALGAGD